MKSFFTILVTFLIGLSLIINTADAKRFGGGRAIGKSWSSQSAASSGFGSMQNKLRSAVRPSLFNNGFKSALMGLLAGGLIASLFLGGGFHGFQPFDILIFVAVGFFVWRFVSSRKPINSPNIPGAYPPHSSIQAYFDNHSTTDKSSSSQESPPWFDQTQFIHGAKKHYITLQEAWDKGDMEIIKPYCDPIFYQEISSERNKLNGVQQTEILSLDARLITVTSEENTIIAHIEFSALLREDQETKSPPKDVIEIWSVQHSRHSKNGDWLIVGIAPQ